MTKTFKLLAHRKQWIICKRYTPKPTSAYSVEMLTDIRISCGLDGFDMADHYGDAELITGHHHSTSVLRSTAFTKWCPTSQSQDSFKQAQDAVDLALNRMAQKQIALLQC